MKLTIYSIYDTATAAYVKPIFLQSDGQAIRLFTDATVAADSEIAKHPEDYSLVRLGIWDDQTAKFSLEDKETLITGNEALAQARKVTPFKAAANYGGTE